MTDPAVNISSSATLCAEVVEFVLLHRYLLPVLREVIEVAQVAWNVVQVGCRLDHQKVVVFIFFCSADYMSENNVLVLRFVAERSVRSPFFISPFLLSLAASPHIVWRVEFVANSISPFALKQIVQRAGGRCSDEARDVLANPIVRAFAERVRSEL